MISKNSSHSTTSILKDVISKAADDLSKSLNYSNKKKHILGEIFFARRNYNSDHTTSTMWYDTRHKKNEKR